MALHKLVVDDFYDTSFSLLAIHCELEDYRLAYLLNKHLDLNLSRMDRDLDYKYFAASYSIYEWQDIENETTWNLVSNVCKREEDSLQSSGSLFTNQNKVLKTFYLLPEFKNVDYLLKISDETLRFKEKKVLNKIQSIPQVITSYSIDVEDLKSKDNLIF
ncbi:IPExxxVDY family protein [Geojedonia litorea]|uniref:IPExxxVDY family protein n=1 Tax=Geojedonia litorea TaxID=1268269 RepID=A0ABV9N4N1_9FLAO